MSASLRGLRAGDLDAVVSIDHALTGRGRRDFFQKRFRAVMESPDARLGLVATAGDRVVGYVFADVLSGEFGEDAPVGVLGVLGVAPELRGAGVGRALLEATSERCRALGARHVRTEAEWAAHGLATFFASNGFVLAPRLVLQRGLDAPVMDPQAEEESEEAPRTLIRSLEATDLPSLVRVDHKITGRDREPYFVRKVDEVLRRSGVRVSLVAEVDGIVVGFVMARVDLGEFGRLEPSAVLDTIGVHPDFRAQHLGTALMAQLVQNLGSLQVEQLVTQVDWERQRLLGFLARMGFRPSQRLAFEKTL